MLLQELNQVINCNQRQLTSKYPVSSEFKEKPSINSMPQVQLRHEKHSKRIDAEKFIAQNFKAKHGALVTHFMPMLMTLEHPVLNQAVIGLETKNFFLNQYLECSIESLLEATSLYNSEESKLIEIGNFSADNGRVGSILFLIMAQSVYAAGFDWLIFTATSDVERMIRYLNCKPKRLADAPQSKLGEKAKKWGCYYKNNPQVMACHLPQTIDNLNQKKRIVRTLNEYSSQIEELTEKLVYAMSLKDGS